MYTSKVTIKTSDLMEWLVSTGKLHKAFADSDLIGLDREVSKIGAQREVLAMYDNLIFSFETPTLKED